ncbi:hypothetical protein SCLCIDRAFT_1214500 [Scleroderma citrinum Foug A]|uniref:Uncharacterized protein n=1 Tax=Scleroderma citrinum Foug A TaxID=1036808 RepID=A0A0C3ADE1_9AGAM|nr:hypothetical protein SCLCIDRAFT_1214500 [Scleroderma citrinum Foug A]
MALFYYSCIFYPASTFYYVRASCHLTSTPGGYNYESADKNKWAYLGMVVALSLPPAHVRC